MLNSSNIKNLIGLVAAILFVSCKPSPKQWSGQVREAGYTIREGTYILFVGTYTEKESWVDGKAEGIYEYEMDQKTGALSFVCKSAKTINPSYLAIHPSKQCLYAVNETIVNKQDSTGSVSVFQIDIAHKRLELAGSVSSCGKSPCYVSVDKYGKYVMVANYGSGTVALLPVARFGFLQEAVSVDRHAGHGTNPRQEGPHAHMITPSPYKDFVYSVDLGTDQIDCYELNRSGSKLIPTGRNTSTAPGAGPRQMVFHASRPWAYVINELNGTIEAFKVDKNTGELNRFQSISTYAQGKGEIPASADIQIAPSGKFLYASNRGNVNNIAMFRIYPESGELDLLGYQSTLGKAPRNFVIDPSGKYLLVANQDSDNVVTFRIDAETGKLIETGIITSIPTPVCLKFL